MCALPVTFLHAERLPRRPHARFLFQVRRRSRVCCAFFSPSARCMMCGVKPPCFNFRGQMCQVSILHCNGLYQPQRRKPLRLERTEWMFDYFCILFVSLHHGSSKMRILRMTFQMYRIWYYDSSSRSKIQPQLLNLHLRWAECASRLLWSNN